MAELKTNEEVYDFIGELAIALYSKKIQISLGSPAFDTRRPGKGLQQQPWHGHRRQRRLQEMEGQGPGRLPRHRLHLHGQGRQPRLGQGLKADSTPPMRAAIDTHGRKGVQRHTAKTRP